MAGSPGVNASVPAISLDEFPEYSAGKPSSPERALALTVLLYAAVDVRAVDRSAEPARQFCFARRGSWARSRKMWCQMADIDESWFVKRVLKIIEQGFTPAQHIKLAESVRKQCL